MAQFIPYRVKKSKLSSLPIKEGQFICLTDSSEMYLDVSNTQRLALVAQMTGASANANGATGLVPPPSAGSNTKFLKGDGTWSNLTGALTLTDDDQGNVSMDIDIA